MRITALALSSLALIGGCTTYFSYGGPLNASHNVSLHELIGNATWFDGQPISTMGVADFQFQFESTSKLYASEEDFENFTYSYIVMNVPAELEAMASELRRLNGKYVRVSGLFYAFERERLPAPDENDGNSMIITVCQGICGAIGEFNVISVAGWQ